MEHNPDDLRLSFCTEQGVKIELYDTYCRNFTSEDQAAAEAKISDILYRAELRRHLAGPVCSNTASQDGAGPL